MESAKIVVEKMEKFTCLDKLGGEKRVMNGDKKTDIYTDVHVVAYESTNPYCRIIKDKPDGSEEYLGKVFLMYDGVRPELEENCQISADEKTAIIEHCKDNRVEMRREFDAKMSPFLK